MFIFRTTVHFFDADAAGVLFYGKAFELCHAAFEAFIASKKKYQEYFTSGKFAFPIVHAEASFFTPLFPGEEIIIETEVSEIKDSSFSLCFRIKNQKEVIAEEIKTVSVSIGKDKWQKIALPPFVIDLLKEL
ncbi:MAG: thioesterase family protein [Ignavibacteriaceae bacterium]